MSNDKKYLVLKDIPGYKKDSIIVEQYQGIPCSNESEFFQEIKEEITLAKAKELIVLADIVVNTTDYEPINIEEAIISSTNIELAIRNYRIARDNYSKH